MTRLSASVALLVGATLLLGGCAALHDDMQRAENSYTQARYDDALVWLASLEDDTPDMDVGMRARYYYLRGMTDYRLGHRDDALHYLALAREVAHDDDRGLRPGWKQSMQRTLAELTPTDASHTARAAGADSGAAPSVHGTGTGGGAAAGTGTGGGAAAGTATSGGDDGMPPAGASPSVGG